MDLEGFHPAETKPVVGQDPDHSTNRGETLIILEGYFPAPVFPIPGVMTEEFRNIGDPHAGKGVNRFRARPPDMIKGCGKFPEKHKKSLK
jgi:hypothetical protein